MKLLVSLLMDAAINPKRLDLRVEIREEVSSKTGLLRFIKVKSFDQILPGVIEDFQLHEVSSAICRFAVSQSTNCASPLSIRRWRSSSTSLCHWGTGTSSSRRERDCHNSSIARSFSSTVI